MRRIIRSITRRLPKTLVVLGNETNFICSAVTLYFSIERPRSTGFLPIAAAHSAITFTREMCDEKAETMIACRSSSRLVMTSRTRPPAIRSLGDRPECWMYGLSTITASTPSFPSCRNRAKSGGAPMTGVWSNLKSQA